MPIPKFEFNREYISLTGTYKNARDFFFDKADKDDITYREFRDMGLGIQDCGRKLHNRIKRGRFVDESSQDETLTELYDLKSLVSDVDDETELLADLEGAIQLVERMEFHVKEDDI